MTQAERDRLCVIRATSDGRMSRREAAERLGVLPREIRKLVVAYRERGDGVAVHGLKGRPGNRGRERCDEDLAELVATIYGAHCVDYSVAQFTERLAEAYFIELPRETVRRMLASEGVRVPKRTRHERHPRRPRRSRFGELIQLDTSIHAWFEGRAADGREPVLICAIDDATSRVNGRFFEGDTVHANQAVIRRWIERHGRPEAFYYDCAGHFAGQLDEDGGDNRNETQIGRMLGELDVEPILAYSPQAKGRVERTFGTHQNRLVKKLRERGIATIEAANEYLDNEYWEEHNGQFAVAPADAADAHRVLRIEQQRRFREICAVRFERTLQSGDVVKVDGRFLLVKAGGRRGPRRGAKIEVVEEAAAPLRLRYEDRDLAYEDVTERFGVLTGDRRRAADRATQRARLVAELQRKGVADPPLESLSVLELQALRPAAKPTATHPWRKVGFARSVHCGS